MRQGGSRGDCGASPRLVSSEGTTRAGDAKALAGWLLAQERWFHIPDAPDRAYGWRSLNRIRASLRLQGTPGVVKEFVDRKPHTMLRLTDAGRDAFQKYREGMMQVLGGDG